MQEPEQWQSFETPGMSGQEEQKIYPQETLESRVNVFNIRTIVLSGIGFGPAIVGLVGSALVLSNRDGSQYLLTGGILGLVGSILALLLFVAIFVPAVIRAARYQRLRFR